MILPIDNSGEKNMRKILIAGNWKMYKTQKEAKEIVQNIINALKDVKDVDILIIPPFTDLLAVRDLLNNTNIKLGAQNMHWEKEGAFTGEVSPLMLKETGCEFVIIGHSERRQYFSETDSTVNKKIKSALLFGLKPIFCIGETLLERENNKYEEVVARQIEIGLSEISKEQLKDIIIAYEPVWAIGTGKTATPQIANSMHKFIRDKIKKLYNIEIAENIIILYGGSVKPENTASLIEQSDIDGALVGGASIQVDSFVKIVYKSALN